MSRTRHFLPFGIALLIAVGIFITLAHSEGAPSSKAHVREIKDDLFGYYMPDREIKSGSMVFRMFSLGGPEEFDIYESGKNEYENYAPFMFQFEDISSKKGENELGGIYYENSPRVLPVTYQITKEALVFTGTDKQLGKVSFKGRMDLAALKKAQKSEAYDKVVVVGDLTFAGKTFKKVEFTWFAGD